MCIGCVIIYTAISLILACIIHEFGHSIVSKLLTGKFLEFRFAFGKFYVPRFIWYMPNTTRLKQRFIAAAGFLTEFMAIPLMAIIDRDYGSVYGLVALFHIIAYNFYAGDASDFKWL